MVYTQTIITSLLSILIDIEREDEYIRQRMLREAKQLELYWHGFQYIFWDENSQDFRIPTHDIMDQISSREETKFVYDYVINIFKAHGLSIIAALSAEIPNVAFSPMDADVSKDVVAAKKAELAGKIIIRKNKARLLFYHALFTLFTNHFVASYTYYERDKKHGMTQITKFRKKREKISPDLNVCPECQYFNDDIDPDPETNYCPNCETPLKRKEGEMGDIQIEDGMEDVPLGMSKIQVFGTLNTKLPSYAADQADMGYLIHYSDQHYAYLRSIFPELRDEIGTDGADDFERIARMPSIGRIYSDTYMTNLQVLKKIWLRPHMFETLDKIDADELKEAFPDGVYFAVINENLFAEARPEDMDDHWTIAKGDLSRAIHADPLGKPLLPLQDLENMVSNLLVESLEHSVPATFADPAMLDFDTYSKQEVLPGAIYPAKEHINPQKRMEDYFYTLKTSTLPKEGVDFNKVFETKAQFVVGAFPSIFGGPQKSGSKTLGEYQESRAYALQRLSIPYQMLAFWWADTIHKAVVNHAENMVSDEHYADKTADGAYLNISLLQEELNSGRFQQLLPEAAIGLPTSFTQKRRTVEQMIQLNNDHLTQFLFSPENRSITLRFLGMEELSDLDANQALKQIAEIDRMLAGGEEVQVATEPVIDDDEIHLRIIRSFLASDKGQEHKVHNPNSYQKIVTHAEEHYKNLLEKMQLEQQVEEPEPKKKEPVSARGE